MHPYKDYASIISPIDLNLIKELYSGIDEKIEELNDIHEELLDCPDALLRLIME